jgi:hypothetical protein
MRFARERERRTLLRLVSTCYAFFFLLNKFNVRALGLLCMLLLGDRSKMT